jgi:transposase
LHAGDPVEPEPGDVTPLRQGAVQGAFEIECTFNLLKQARRFATRYEKTLRNYAAVVALGCAMLWLRI